MREQRRAGEAVRQGRVAQRDRDGLNGRGGGERGAKAGEPEQVEGVVADVGDEVRDGGGEENVGEARKVARHGEFGRGLRNQIGSGREVHSTIAVVVGIVLVIAIISII